MIQIFSNNTFLDVPEDFNIPINRSIADIREPENRQSDWTKTFTLAGTATNKEYFSHLYHINYDITAGTQFAPDFNPNYRASAEIWVDNIPQLKGFLRLIQINVVNDEQIEFECSIHGVTAELFTQVRGLNMSDLDFNEYNHEFNTTNVVNSWSSSIIVNGSSTAGGAGIGYIYGLVNDGRLSSYNSVTLDFYKPFLYAKTVVDKILSNAGFSYTTDSFFNSDVFKGLIMSSDVGTPPSVAYLFNASASVDTAINIGDVLKFDTETDPNNIFNLATDAITLGTKSAGLCDVVIQGNVKMSGVTANEIYDVSWVLKQNGVAIHLGTSVVSADAGGAVNDTIYINFNTKYLGYGTIYTVELLDIIPRNSLSIFPTGLTMAAGFQMYNVKQKGLTPTQTIQFDQFFTGDIKQEEVLKSFINMFNLYIDKDENGDLVVLPYEEYYDGVVKDWSRKLDKSQKLSIYPMGELNTKRFYFTYADSEDIFNKDYKAVYNRNYGDLYVDIDNDFVKDQKDIKVVFKPTQVYTAEGRTYPLINEFNGIHLLFHDSVATTNPYSIYEDLVIGSASVPSITSDVYPLTIHTDTNITPTLDILFGVPFEAGYPANVTYTDNNLYNAYWKKYINEITDPNSKVVSGYFHITPADFAALSFRDTYFFENSYFRLNQITDYIPDRLTLCEFVQLQTYPSFTPSSGDIGQTDWQELMGGKVLKIGEAQVFGDKDLIVGYKGGYTSNASKGNFIAGSSGVIIDGSGNVVLMSQNMNISGSDKMYLFGKEVDLSSPTAGESMYFDGTKWIANAGAGSGDMTKAEYDTDNDGVVDEAETLSGLTATITELNYTDGVTAPIQPQLDGKQPLDSDLTSIAGLTPTNDDFIQRKSGAWTNRSVSQVKTDLGLTGTNSGDQTSIVGITGTKSQFDTAVTDGNFMYIGDAPTAHTHPQSDITNLTTDLAAKAPLASPTFTGTVTTPAIIVSSETASRVAIIDASKNIKSADTATYPSLTELAYVKGVTSAIQTQIDGKQATLTNGYGLSGTTTKAVALTTAEAFATAETTLSAVTYADITGASISLAAGTWLILATINGASQTTTVAVMMAAITDGSNAVIAEGSQHLVAGTATVRTWGNVSLSAIVSPSGTTTYKLRGARGTTTQTGNWIASDGNGVNTANNVSNNSDKGTSIRAIRIA